MHEGHQRIKQYLTTDDIERMTDADIIKHVYMIHKKTKTSVEDVWQLMFDNLGEQTISKMLRDSGTSLNNDKNLEYNSKFVQVGMVVTFAFFIVWVVITNLMNDKFLAREIAFGVGGFVSIWIAILFMNMAGKNERKYLNAVNRLQLAYDGYQNVGFKDMITGKPLDYVKDNE